MPLGSNVETLDFSTCTVRLVVAICNNNTCTNICNFAVFVYGIYGNIFPLYLKAVVFYWDYFAPGISGKSFDHAFFINSIVAL